MEALVVLAFVCLFVFWVKQNAGVWWMNAVTIVQERVVRPAQEDVKAVAQTVREENVKASHAITELSTIIARGSQQTSEQINNFSLRLQEENEKISGVVKTFSVMLEMQAKSVTSVTSQTANGVKNELKKVSDAVNHARNDAVKLSSSATTSGVFTLVVQAVISFVCVNGLLSTKIGEGKGKMQYMWDMIILILLGAFMLYGKDFLQAMHHGFEKASNYVQTTSTYMTMAGWFGVKLGLSKKTQNNLSNLGKKLADSDPSDIEAMADTMASAAGQPRPDGGWQKKGKHMMDKAAERRKGAEVPFVYGGVQAPSIEMTEIKSESKEPLLEGIVCAVCKMQLKSIEQFDQHLHIFKYFIMMPTEYARATYELTEDERGKKFEASLIQGEKIYACFCLEPILNPLGCSGNEYFDAQFFMFDYHIDPLTYFMRDPIQKGSVMPTIELFRYSENDCVCCRMGFLDNATLQSHLKDCKGARDYKEHLTYCFICNLPINVNIGSAQWTSHVTGQRHQSCHAWILRHINRAQGFPFYGDPWFIASEFTKFGVYYAAYAVTFLFVIYLLYKGFWEEEESTLKQSPIVENEILPKEPEGKFGKSKGGKSNKEYGDNNRRRILQLVQMYTNQDVSDFGPEDEMLVTIGDKQVRFTYEQREKLQEYIDEYYDDLFEFLDGVEREAAPEVMDVVRISPTHDVKGKSTGYKRYKYSTKKVVEGFGQNLSWLKNIWKRKDAPVLLELEGPIPVEKNAEGFWESAVVGAGMEVGKYAARVVTSLPTNLTVVAKPFEPRQQWKPKESEGKSLPCLANYFGTCTRSECNKPHVAVAEAKKIFSTRNCLRCKFEIDSKCPFSHAAMRKAKPKKAESMEANSKVPISLNDIITGTVHLGELKEYQSQCTPSENGIWFVTHPAQITYKLQPLVLRIQDRVFEISAKEAECFDLRKTINPKWVCKFVASSSVRDGKGDVWVHYPGNMSGIKQYSWSKPLPLAFTKVHMKGRLPSGSGWVAQGKILTNTRLIVYDVPTQVGDCGLPLLSNDGQSILSIHTGGMKYSVSANEGVPWSTFQ